MRDLACTEFPTKGREHRGPFVFQAKFVQGANGPDANPRTSLLGAIRAENKRIEERREDGVWKDPEVYAFLTNAPIGPALRRELTAEIHTGIPGAADVVLIGSRQLDAWLDQYPNVRLSFPQILGLRDLVALLDSVVTRDVRNRSTLAVEAAKSLAQVFVPTRAYTHALTTLSGHGCTVLTGPPEMGKTAIARMIALAQLTSKQHTTPHSAACS